MRKSDDKRYNCIFAFVFFVMPLVYILAQLHRTSGPFFPPDEFGYWENVAKMLGFDWSGSMFMQSYYAKGYSLLLYPFARIFESPMSMYKAALVLNAVLFGAQGWVLLCFVNELRAGSLIGSSEEFSADTNACVTFFIAAAGAFYPAHFVYMNYTIAEMLITLLVTLVFFLLLKYENTNKPVFACLSILFAVALLFTHFRTAGVLLVVVFSMFILRQKERGRTVPVKPVAWIIVALIILAVVLAVSPLRSGIGYLDDQLNRLQQLLTVEGAADITMGTVGKLFYICVSTFGLFFFAIAGIWRKRKESVTLVAFAISLFISICISAVFFVGGKEIDYLVYGRYTEIFVPIIICLGLCEVRDGYKPDRRFGIICSFAIAGAAILLVIYAGINGMNVYMNDFIIGLSWMFGKSNPSVNRLLGIPSIVSVLSLWVIIWLAGSDNRERILKFVSPVIMAVFICIGAYMSEVCVYDFHEVDRSDVELFETVTAMYDEGRQVDFLRPPGVNYIGHLQFYMFDRTINYIDGPDPEAFTTAPDDVVVTYPNYEFMDMLRDKYGSIKESAHFVVFCN